MRMGALTVVSVMAASFAFAAQPASLPTVNGSMTQVMSVNAQTIWDVSSKAFNVQGDGLVASAVTAKDWTLLADAAKAINARARLLAKTSRTLVVAGPDEWILGEEASHAGVKTTWDAASREQIKALIDADSALFSKRAAVLADAMADLVKASKTRDIAVLYRVSSVLDEHCDGCHELFWGTDEPPPASRAREALRRFGR